MGTLSDVFTDQNDKQNLKALVIMESEQMLQKQEKLDRLSREQVNQNDIAKGEADSPSTQNPSDQNTSGNNTVNNQENAKPKAEPHPLALLLAERQKIFGKPKLPNPEAENKSKELLDKMSKQMYNGWKPAIKPPESEEIKDEIVAKAKVSEIKTNESMEPEASVSDNELAAKLAESEEEGDKDKVDNNNNQEKQKDENNNPKDDIDEDAPLKKPPKKGKLNNLVEKIPKKELTDPVDIQLAQVTGK